MPTINSVRASREERLFNRRGFIDNCATALSTFSLVTVLEVLQGTLEKWDSLLAAQDDETIHSQSEMKRIESDNV